MSLLGLPGELWHKMASGEARSAYNEYTGGKMDHCGKLLSCYVHFPPFPSLLLQMLLDHNTHHPQVPWPVSINSRLPSLATCGECYPHSSLCAYKVYMVTILCIYSVRIQELWPSRCCWTTPPMAHCS